MTREQLRPQVSRPETREIMEHEYPYDAVIVLGGGLTKNGDDYYPTDYRQGDEFGMLGAGMRMVAATELYLNHQSINFVFTTGVTKKNKNKFGPEVPTEASAMEGKFLRSLKGLKNRPDFGERFSGLEEPTIVLEDRSFNTASNIENTLQIIQDKGWKKLAFVSSDYHIPRIQALYQGAIEGQENGLSIDFVSAEKYVESARPGRYSAVIERSYESEKAQKRIVNERQGLRDMANGT